MHHRPLTRLGLLTALTLFFTATIVKAQPKDSMITAISCTISPSNKASQGFFSSFAKTHGLILKTSSFIKKTHFGDEDHEAEELYTLKAADNTTLIPYFS